MTIQRTYSLPNCTLLIEGISLGDSSTLALLTNFECKFHHNQASIAGGRNLLNALVKSVSRYAQALQEGMPTSIADAPANPVIRLEPVGTYQHRLIVHPGEEDAPDSQPQEIQLNTVQLFDLLEGIDLLCTDSHTLPDLNLKIESGIVSQSRSSTNVLAAVSGVTGLAIAASGLFFVPVPAPDPQPQISTQSTKLNPQANSKPVATPKPSPLPPAISDRDLITKLQEDIRDELDEAWTIPPKFDGDVIYRIAVNAEGKIVGYRALDLPKAIAEDDLPVKRLRVVPIDPATGGSPATPQPTTTFIVTFKPDRTLTVEQNK